MSEENGNQEQGQSLAYQGDNNLPIMPEWAANLPQDLVGDDGSRNFLNRFKDGDKVEVPVTLVKSAIENHRMQGTMVTVPGENATPDQLNAFNKKIGVPDTADGYEFKVPENSPEGIFTDDAINAFRADAHEIGVPKKKAEELFSRFAGRQVETYNTMMTNHQGAIDQRVNDLKKELGKDFDATVKTADKAVHFADPGMVELFDKAGLLGHPAIVKGFAKIGKAMGEDVLRGVETTVPSQKLTREELDQMIKDPKYRLPEGDPVGKAWRAKVSAGFDSLYPGQAGADIGPSSGRPLHPVE